MKKIFLLIIAVVFAFFAWRYFTQPKTAPISGMAIEIKNSAFSPNSLTVKAGEKFTLVNRDFMGHSLTADNGSFDSGILGKNESKSITAPAKAGTYKFHCQVHPTTMTGTLIVK